MTTLKEQMDQKRREDWLDKHLIAIFGLSGTFFLLLFSVIVYGWAGILLTLAVFCFITSIYGRVKKSEVKIIKDAIL